MTQENEGVHQKIGRYAVLDTGNPTQESKENLQNDSKWISWDDSGLTDIQKSKSDGKKKQKAWESSLREAEVDRMCLNVLKGDVYLEYKKGCALGNREKESSFSKVGK